MPSKAAVVLPLLLLGSMVLSNCTALSPVPPRDHRSAKTGATTPNKNAIKSASKYGMKDVRQLDSSISVDLRYATSNNVTGNRLYPSNMPCLLKDGAAQALAQANKELKKSGLCIKVWDAYRPPRSHKALWKAVQDPRYVVPATETYSWHCVGVAVDVTLTDLKGRELEMPTDFDEFSEAASAYYKGPSAEVRQRVYLLQKAMKNAGFTTIASEWWHFQYTRAKSGGVVFARQLGIDLPPHVSSLKIP